jgi:hypothetical protein
MLMVRFRLPIVTTENLITTSARSVTGRMESNVAVIYG